MATNDWRTGTYANDPQGRGNFDKQGEVNRGQKFTIVRYFDASAVNMASADLFKICTIDAGVMVEGVKVAIGTAEGGTCTMDIGDSASGTTFDDGIDLNGTAGVVESSSTLLQKYYSAANYILLTMNNAADAAKFWVLVDCVRLT